MHAASNSRRQRFRRQVRQRQRLRLGLGQRTVRPAILRMGVPVSPRNIFPSNIQGLPTWYEVRVSRRAGSAGAAASTDGRDEPADLGPRREGDRARRLPVLRFDQAHAASKFRDDINVIGVPLTAICNATYSDPRQRQLFKNIIYVGALWRAARHRPSRWSKRLFASSSRARTS
jgi:hypothetical protein